MQILLGRGQRRESTLGRPPSRGPRPPRNHCEQWARSIASSTGKQVFDLVLADVQMPEMDGLQLARAIREREKKTDTHLPIIAMTAYAMKGDRERCLEAGMDAYVAKPINAAQLFETIDGVWRAELKANAQLSVEARLEILNEPTLLSRFEGDSELLKEVVELFLDDFPRC